VDSRRIWLPGQNPGSCRPPALGRKVPLFDVVLLVFHEHHHGFQIGERLLGNVGRLLRRREPRAVVVEHYGNRSQMVGRIVLDIQIKSYHRPVSFIAFF
jgi:hypothetical protein